MNIINKLKLCSMLLFAAILSGAGVHAADQDLTVKFMLDASGAMQQQKIVYSASSILAAELCDFIRDPGTLPQGSSIRLLVDSFWQKDSDFLTQGVFDYRIGQSGNPNYDGLRDLQTKWFIKDETSLNRLVNRNWPAENRNTIMVILTNSQENLDPSEIIAINTEAQKVNSKLFLAILPRKNNYEGDALKAEIAKRIHLALMDVKSYIQQLRRKWTKPAAGFSIFPESGIAPLTISTTNSSTNAQKYQWNWGDGTPEAATTAPSHTYRDPGSYTITLTVRGENGDIVRKKMKITVSAPGPVAKFTFSPGGNVESAVAFTDSSLNAVRRVWNFGDGSKESTEKDPKHLFAKAGSYKVVLKVFNADGVSAQTSANVRINEKLAVSFETEVSPEDSCTVKFRNTSKGAVKYSWDFGDGEESTEKDPEHTFRTAVTKGYFITLTAFAENGQKLTSTERITVTVSEQKAEEQALTADFSYEMLSNTETPTCKFKNTSRGGVKYSWDFGDGSVSRDSSPVHAYKITAPKDFKVVLTAFAANGQTDRKTMTVKVVPGSSESSFGTILTVLIILAAAGIIAAVKLLRKGKSFTVTLFSRENKLLGKKAVKVREIVQLTSLNASGDLDFQIVKSEDDDDSDFKVRFRKPADSPSVLKQKTIKIHLGEQWGDAIDMANLTVDSGRLVFSDGENDEGEDEK